MKPDIVVATVGAHILADDATFRDLVDEVLMEMQQLRRERPDINIAFKTQNPGGCTREILSPQDANIAARKMNFTEMEYNGKKTYNWGRFYERDLMLLHRLQKFNIPYLDMRMLYSRSDSHIDSQSSIRRDCLHICAPGPLDVIGRLFRQLLLELV